MKTCGAYNVLQISHKLLVSKGGNQLEAVVLEAFQERSLTLATNLIILRKPL